MTAQRMIDLLGFRLEDTGARKFGIDVRLDVLNDSQLLLVNMFHNDLLTELQAKEQALVTVDGTTVEDDYYALTGLASEIARNGLVNARMSGANGKYINIIQPKDVKQTENTYLAGTDDYPIGYVWKNRFYVRASTNIPTIDLWYIKKPSDLKYTYVTDSVANGGVQLSTNGYFIEVVEADLTSAVNDFYNGSVLYNKTKEFYAIVYDYVGATNTLHVLYDQAESAEWAGSDEFYFVKGPGSNEKLGDFESELNDSFHEIVVDLAESTLFKMVSDMGRSDKALEKAMSQINVLNARAESEAAAGVGTTAKGS